MNEFLQATKKMLSMHGMLGTYISSASGVYNIETGKVTNSETSYSVQMYKKHLKASQYNFPDLIGKDAAIFYIANDSLAFVPKINDKITYNAETFMVSSYAEHIAKGSVVLYKLIAVKG